MYQRDFSRACAPPDWLERTENARPAASRGDVGAFPVALARMKRERARKQSKHAEKRLKAAFSVQSNTYTQIPGKGRFTPT